MSNPNLVRLLRESVQESRQDQHFEKLLLIDDIIRVKKLLYAQGIKEHNEFLTDKGRVDLFDELYDMYIEQLQLINTGYERQINTLMTEKLQEYLK